MLVYPRPLVLEVEPHAPKHKFLETITHTGDQWIRVQHSNHNGEAMMNMQPLKRLNRPSPTSNINTGMIITQLYGELHRIKSNCSDDLAIVQAIMELWLELQEFGWPAQWLQTAMHKYMYKDTNKVWEEIYNFIQHEGSYGKHARWHGY